jgi:hypothetical protein
MKRSVYEQELLINDSAKQRLFDNLILRSPQVKAIIPTNLLIKNLDGCSYHNKTLGSTVIYKKTQRTTYRSILTPYFDNHFYEKLGTSIILEKVDQFGTYFLPFELLKV